MSMDEIEDISTALVKENEHLAVDISQTTMPLDMTVRSVALTLATRHCGDRTVKEGNLYQQLKMDNKLGGPLTTQDVIHCALIFERFLWGEWSKGLVGEAVRSSLDSALGEAEQALNEKFKGEDDEPIRPHGGE